MCWWSLEGSRNDLVKTQWIITNWAGNARRGALFWPKKKIMVAEKGTAQHEKKKKLYPVKFGQERNFTTFPILYAIPQLVYTLLCKNNEDNTFFGHRLFITGVQCFKGGVSGRDRLVLFSFNFSPRGRLNFSHFLGGGKLYFDGVFFKRYRR